MGHIKFFYTRVIGYAIDAVRIVKHKHALNMGSQLSLSRCPAAQRKWHTMYNDIFVLDTVSVGYLRIGDITDECIPVGPAAQVKRVRGVQTRRRRRGSRRRDAEGARREPRGSRREGSARSGDNGHER